MTDAHKAAIEAMAMALHDEWYGVGRWSSLTDTERARWDYMAKAALSALLSTLPALGWRLVPVEPTPDMNIRGSIAWVDALRSELTAARARVAKLEAFARDTAKQKTTDEMTHQEGLLADWEGGFDTIIERAREALKP